MPIHDWNRVDAGIFHAFHHRWVSAISDVLNGTVLPEDYYALPEQQAAGFGPDVLTLQTTNERGESVPTESGNTATIVQTRPQTQFTAETDVEFYRRKMSSIAVRHVSGDRIVAMIEIISPGNKASRHALRALVEKACELLEHRIHLLIVDPLLPSVRAPNGVHAAIWQEVQDHPFRLPANKPLSLVAYECALTTRAYIEVVAVGDRLPDMPLFLEPGGHVPIPLESTYQTAFAAMPRRWQSVLEAST